MAAVVEKPVSLAQCVGGGVGTSCDLNVEEVKGVVEIAIIAVFVPLTTEHTSQKTPCTS